VSSTIRTSAIKSRNQSFAIAIVCAYRRRLRHRPCPRSNSIVLPACPLNPLLHRSKAQFSRHASPLQVLQTIPILHSRGETPLERAAHHDFFAKQTSSRGRAVDSGVRRNIAEHASTGSGMDGVWRSQRARRHGVFFIRAAEVGRIHVCGWPQRAQARQARLVAADLVCNEFVPASEERRECNG
jgi:hypothetical protein